MTTISKEVKIAVIGMNGNGKSNLVLRFVKDKFIDLYDPTLEDDFEQDIVVNGESLKLMIRDTAGFGEDFTSNVRLLSMMFDVFVLCIPQDSSSLESPFDLIQTVLQCKIPDEDETIPILIAQTKSDVEKADGFDEGLKKLCRWEWNGETEEIQCVECSAKKGQGITEVFQEVVKIHLKREEEKMRKEEGKKGFLKKLFG
eukprot:TRINITY_DN7019_c0_g1_i1.p1 TRINITY_DN7019_c0_g1~~TRINITY_DN7019_c0_g1_i1.p1  ORF type:complete len:212 (+),score=72.50 TRINITY_DN7019_c0_g1_i1:38-637(+)